MKKRILSMALAALLLIGCVGVTASAGVGSSAGQSGAPKFTVSNVLSQEILSYEQILDQYKNSNLIKAIDTINSDFWNYDDWESTWKLNKYEVFHCYAPATLTIEQTYIEGFALSVSDVLGSNYAGWNTSSGEFNENSTSNRYAVSYNTYQSEEYSEGLLLREGSYITALNPGVYIAAVREAGMAPYYYFIDVTGDSSTATTDVVITGEQQYEYSKQFRYEIRNASNSMDKRRYAIIFTHFIDSSLYPDFKQSTEIHFLNDSDIPAGIALSGNFYSQRFSYSDNAKTVTSTYVIAFENASEMNTVVAGAPLLDMSNSLAYDGRDYNAYYDPNGLCFMVDDSTIGEQWLKDTFGITR